MTTLTPMTRTTSRATPRSAALPTPDVTVAPAASRTAVSWMLRLEGGVMLAIAVLAYAHLGGSWGSFAALFLLPDLSLLGYLASPHVGAQLYNVGHSYLSPALLAALATLAGAPALLLGALIWVAHIGFDRLVGYGLKFREGFGHTHLGRVGAAARGG